jgi:hypothetical protein
VSAISLGNDYSSITYSNQYRNTWDNNSPKPTNNWCTEPKSYTAPTKIVKSDFLFSKV